MTPTCWAMAYAPTGVCSAALHVADPRLVELRAWSRLAEELTEERVRLSNRVHHELWRYYPQMQKIADDDLAAPWFLELGTSRPRRPKHASYASRRSSSYSSSIASVASMPTPCFAYLREPAIKVAEGVAEAASVHLRSLIARLHVVNRELRQADAKLDELCAAIGETEAALGRMPSTTGRHDPQIRCPVSAGSTSRHCSAKALGLSAAVIIQRCEPCAVPHRSPSAAASRTSSSCATRRMPDCATRSITGPASPPSTTPRAASRYAALRQRGHSHGRALRGVADRLLGLACVLLQRQTLFDPHFAQAK